MKRSLQTLGVLATATAIPLAAAAQPGSSGPQYFTPPKLIKQGTATTPIAGNGTVVVQVLVKPDGSFQVQKILRSTNHADDQAALEIAKTSKYRPATRGSKPVLAFYDFTLRFTGSSVENAAAGGTTAGGGGGAAANINENARFARMLRTGDYSGAKSGLTQYLAAHPNDAQAEAELGVADTFLNDYAGATAAFDRAGRIPENYRSVAAKAYAERALAQLSTKNTAALAAARRAVELAPEYATYNTLGTVEVQSGDAAAAVRDLERARSEAAAAKVDAKQRAVIDANLVAAYLAAGDTQKAKAVAAEASTLDPSNTSAQLALANDYAKQADADAKAGKPADAAALYEAAAESAPSTAAAMYAQAAFAYLSVQPKPDTARAKAAADKALAIDPNSAGANYAAGVALADDGKTKDALVYLNKADAAAKSSGDAATAARIEATIKQLNGTK